MVRCLGAVADRIDRESHRLMSLVGAVMMLWVVDGLVQLLTGYSVFGNPLIELDSGQALVTGSLRMGYGATLAILSPFYLGHYDAPDREY